jgi:hypothetical protein
MNGARPDDDTPDPRESLPLDQLENKTPFRAITRPANTQIAT